MTRKYRSKIGHQKQVTAPPPPALTSKNSQPSIGETIVGNILTGMTFGAGSSIGHRAVDGVMGNRKVEVESNVTNNIPCEKILETYQMCLQNENNDCNYLQELMKIKCNLN